MELFDTGLESIVETSPDFDESPIEPPAAKKIRKRKATTKKEWERLLKEIHQLSLSEITFCLDTTRSKLTEYTKFEVKEFSLAFEPDNIYFIVKFLRSTFTSLYESCARKKDKYHIYSICFQFQWHQRCSILLVKDSSDLAKLNLHPEDDTTDTQLIIRQQWVSFYQARNTDHEVAKIFMLVFLSEVYNKLLKHCQSVLQIPSDATAVHSTTVHLDPVDVYYRFGGATLASMLHTRYKAMKLELTKHKENISEEIHMLQALNIKDKEKIPKYLKYRDKGFMYFPCEEVMPFLQEVDAAVKTVCNEEGFRKYGKSLVQQTFKFLHSGTKLKEKFSTVVANCLESAECFKPSTLENIFKDLVSKLTNTRIQEFLDSFKATAAKKRELLLFLDRIYEILY